MTMYYKNDVVKDSTNFPYVVEEFGTDEKGSFIIATAAIGSPDSYKLYTDSMYLNYTYVK